MSAHSFPRLRRLPRGFTLVELMVVVAIVGILSTLAIVTFRAYLSRSKNVEAVAVMRAIAAAQERYRAEHLTYLDVSGGSLTRYYPMAAADIGTTRYNWNRPAGNDYAAWRSLAPAVTQPVQFGYATVAGLPGTAFPTTGLSTQPAWPNPTAATGPWYVVQSRAAPGGGPATIKVLSSYSNQVAEEAQ